MMKVKITATANVFTCVVLALGKKWASCCLDQGPWGYWVGLALQGAFLAVGDRPWWDSYDLR